MLRSALKFARATGMRAMGWVGERPSKWCGVAEWGTCWMLTEMEGAVGGAIKHLTCQQSHLISCGLGAFGAKYKRFARTLSPVYMVTLARVIRNAVATDIHHCQIFQV